MFGFFNCNKPIGFTSRDVVNVVQRRLRGRKIKLGHCGTLDPLADGVLVVAAGAAAKLVPFVHEATKRYRGTFRLAAESPTGDLEFEPTIHEHHPVPTLDQVRQACGRFVGEIEQTPPAYSAVKVDGRRAYDLARQGREVNMPSRTVRVQSVEVVSFGYPELTLDITCGTGTYIRSLGMDIARSLGTVAVMTSLRRTRVGEFAIEQAHSIDMLREADLHSLLQPATGGVSHLPQVRVDAEQCGRLANGLPVDPDVAAPEQAVNAAHAAAVLPPDRLVAILVSRRGGWYPKRVFPTAFAAAGRDVV